MPPGDSRRTSFSPQQRSYTRPAPVRSTPDSARQQSTQEATVGIVRNQIENIFQQNAHAAQPAQSAQPAPEQPIAATPKEEQEAQAAAFAEASHTSPDSPYDRTHEADRTELRAAQWNHYHSAWQDYYRQYYERYYIGEVYRMRETLDAHTSPAATPAAAHEELPEQLADNDEAFHRLRADLLQNVRTQTVKVRRSRHFMPALAGGLTLILFWFFVAGGNQLVFANVKAYASPGSINPANIIVDPNINIPISEEPRLIIPKINVDVPVIYETSNDQVSQLQAMEKGVAWFGIPGTTANSKPGQIGNTVLSGHSSNDLFDPGDYKFIFARLDQLVEGDTFFVNYQSKRYVYSITKKEVVRPIDVQKLIYPTDKPVMTLITCVPLGTAQNRLLVTAEQVSPDPTQAEAAPEDAGAEYEEPTMPGNSPNVLQRLFGA